MMEKVQVVKIFFILLVAGFFLDSSDGAACTIGDPSPSTHNTDTDDATDDSFLMDTGSTCCGFLNSWNFYSNSTGTVTSMLWRPTSAGSTVFELIASEDFAASVGLNSAAPAAATQVQPGDKIGWSAAGTSDSMITYSIVATGQPVSSQLLADPFLVGSTITWSVAVDPTRTYGFQAIVDADTAPTIADGAQTITTSDISTNVFPLTIADAETADLTTLTVTKTSGDAAFSVKNDGTNWYIESGASLTVGTYPLVITVDDGCTSVTGTVTITVQDSAPVFNPATLEASYAGGIDDDTTAQTSLYGFSVTDSGTVTCTVDNALFEITDDSANNFELFIAAGTDTSLDNNDATTISTTISCTDGTTTITSTYSVDINDVAPVLTNLGTTGTIGDLEAVGTSIHDFTVTDQDDPITCTVDDARFTIDPSPSTTMGTQVFQIQTATALNADDSPNPVTLTMTCDDGNNAAVTGTHTLTITDDAPTMTGLPATSADQADGAVVAATEVGLFTVTDANDEAAGINCAFNPATTLFSLDNTNVPEYSVSTVVGAVLSGASYELAIVCTDNGGNAVTGTLTVPLTNSPPTFLNLPNTSPTINEDDLAKTSIFTLTVSDTDPVVCEVTDTALSGTILPLVKQTSTNPLETVYEVDAHAFDGHDFEGTGGAFDIEITCGDSEGTVTETLTLNVLNSAPTINNPGGSVTVTEGDATELSLKFIDLLAYDSDATCFIDDDDGAPVEIAPVNVLVKNTGEFDYETQTSHSVVYGCEDAAGLVTYDTFTINVANEGPTPTNLPITYQIDEGQDVELKLGDFDLSEEAFDCKIIAPADALIDFVSKFDPNTNKWGLWYRSQLVAGRTLDYEANPVIPVQIQCKDISGAVGETKIANVKVIDNEAPTIDNVDGNTITHLVLDAKSVFAQDTVFTVVTSDTEGDDITLTDAYSVSGLDCPFNMTATGEIYATKDLHSHTEYYCTIELQATDQYNTDTVIEYLIIEIENTNSKPNITNGYPPCTEIEENNAAGTTVFDISHFDLDEGNPDVIEYTCSWLDGGDAYFACDPTDGTVTAVGVLDYEAIAKKEYYVDVKVNDGYVDSDTVRFCFKIGDVNEEPEFNTALWKLTTDEGEWGKEVGCLELDADITDDDPYDSYTKVINCPNGNGVFHLDDNDCIVMSQEFDLDDPFDPSERVSPYTVACTITAYDRGDPIYSTTTSLQIEVTDKNDQIPWTTFTAYEYCVYPGASNGVLDVINADDHDILTENQVQAFSLNGAGGLFSVNGDGQLSYGDLSSYDVGTNFNFKLKVTDNNNTSEARVTVMVCETPTTTTTTSTSTSTSTSSSSSSTSDMLAWLIPAIIGGLALLAGLGYLLYRCLKSKPGKMRMGMRQMVRRVMVRKRVVGRRVGVRQVNTVRTVRRTTQGYTANRVVQGPQQQQAIQSPQDTLGRRPPASKPPSPPGGGGHPSPSYNSFPQSDYNTSPPDIGSNALATNSFYDRGNIH